MKKEQQKLVAIVAIAVALSVAATSASMSAIVSAASTILHRGLEVGPVYGLVRDTSGNILERAAAGRSASYGYQPNHDPLMYHGVRPRAYDTAYKGLYSAPGGLVGRYPEARVRYRQEAGTPVRQLVPEAGYLYGAPRALDLVEQAQYGRAAAGDYYGSREDALLIHGVRPRPYSNAHKGLYSAAPSFTGRYPEANIDYVEVANRY